MRAIATDGVAWSVCVSACLCVCQTVFFYLLVTFVSKLSVFPQIPFTVSLHDHNFAPEWCIHVNFYLFASLRLLFMHCATLLYVNRAYDVL